MAQQSSSTALKELDEQLTCNVCLDQYTNPKTLPCLHSFCLKCIEKLPQDPQVQTHTQSGFVNTSLFIHLLTGRQVFHKLSFMS